MTDDFWQDADIVFTYTDEEAVEDGVVFPVNAGIINLVTRTVLLDYIEEHEFLEDKFNKFMALVIKEFDLQRKERDDWFYEVTIDGRKFFICENSKGFTLMKPEDY